MNLTIARITARALLGRRRIWVLVPGPILLIGGPLLLKALGVASTHWAPGVIQALGINVVVPLVALIIGTGVLGTEIDDGTIAHILAKPVRRSEIIYAKYAVAVAITWIAAGVPLAVAGLIVGSSSLALGLLVGALAGSLAYCALFLLLSVTSRRPVLIGLIYIMVWEQLLTNILKGTRVLSVEHYVVAIADRIANSEFLSTTVGLPAALAMTFVFAVGASLFAVDRLRSFSVAGETA
jgi:ABC-2 type transport system permease protein